MRRTIANFLTLGLPAFLALGLLAGCSDRSLPTASDTGSDEGRGLRPGQDPLAMVSISPGVFDRVSPSAMSYVDSTDYVVTDGSGSGDVTAALVAIDIFLGAGATASNNPATVGSSTSACEASDFAGFPVGSVALIQRGTCSFAEKVANAAAAGASAVIIFNEGQAGRTQITPATVPSQNLPLLSASYAVGYELYGLTLSGPVTVRVATNTVESSATAAIDAEGTVDPVTGVATVGGSLVCAGVPTIQVRVTVVQEQKARSVTTTMSATQDVTVACDAAGHWTASVLPPTGVFEHGDAVVTAEPLTELRVAAERTVKLKWSKKAK